MVFLNICIQLFVASVWKHSWLFYIVLLLCDLAELSYYKRVVAATFCHFRVCRRAVCEHHGEWWQRASVSSVLSGDAPCLSLLAWCQLRAFSEPPVTRSASLMTRMVKNPSTMQQTWLQFLGWEDLLEKAMAIHSNLLAWRSPWTEEPGELQFMGSQRAGHTWVTSTLSG